MSNIRPSHWLECVSLHPDVMSEAFSEDLFALDLGQLADYLLGMKLGLPKDQLPKVPPVYREAKTFFQASFLTAGIRQLLYDVLDRLNGSAANKVLKLVTPFGGGKSHALATLLHATQEPDALASVPEAEKLPTVRGVRVAVVDGQFFDVRVGKRVPGQDRHIRTIWGWIAWVLGGDAAYNLMREQDTSCTAPSADAIIEVLQGQPSLILLDEVLEYLISAGGIRIEQTTLRDETLTFLKHLCAAIGGVDRTALVFSLQSSKREALEYVGLLQTVDHLAARKDQRREPVEGEEILKVIQQRLLAQSPSQDCVAKAVERYRQVLAQMQRAYATSDAERLQADEEAIRLSGRIRDAYPFHPALIDIMRERWAAIPDFQRTRGALRFLAACLRAAYKEARSRALLGPGDIALHNPEVRLAFFKEVGQQADFQAVLEHDFVGANARAKSIDDRRAREAPTEVGRNAALRIATAILLNSFGGLHRDGPTGEPLPPGISERELLSIVIAPDLDSTTIQACLKELRETCLYLHFDGTRYCFRKDPNVTLLLEQEAEVIARDDAPTRRRIQELLEERLGGRKGAVLWPASPSDIPDGERQFMIGYLPLEFASRTEADQRVDAIRFFETVNGKTRRFRNGLALAVPAADQVEGLRRSVRYLIAAERLKGKSKDLNLTDTQKQQLREREATERAAVESALLKLYSEIWLPRVEGNAIVVDAVRIGSKPLQATVDERHRALIQERLYELLTVVTQKVFETVTPSKIIELFRLGDKDSESLVIQLSEVCEGFFSYLGYPRIVNANVICQAVATGVERGRFAYTHGNVEIGKDRKCNIDGNRLIFRRPMAIDEIDCDVGTLVYPSAIPTLESNVKSNDQNDSGSTGGGTTGPGGTADREATPPTRRRSVEISLLVDRTQIYEAWAAIANLADLAGRVSVNVSAVSESGFDENKLENGVFEPLREKNLME